MSMEEKSKCSSKIQESTVDWEEKSNCSSKILGKHGGLLMITFFLLKTCVDTSVCFAGFRGRK